MRPRTILSGEPRAAVLQVILVAAALLLAPLSTAIAKDADDQDVRWVLAPEAKGASEDMLIKGDRVRFKREDVVLEVELLDDYRRAIFFKSAGLGDVDPFDVKYTGLPAHTFLVRIHNGTDEPVTYRPQTTFFVTTRPLSQATPCDLTCLTSAAHKAELDKATNKRFMRAVLDSAETILPGERLSKLLAFVHVPLSFKKFHLEFSSVQQASKNHFFIVPYRKWNPKKDGPDKQDRAAAESSR